MPSDGDLPDLPGECPIGIPTVCGEENRAFGELRVGAQSLVVGHRDVEAVVARLALEEEDRHLPTRLAGMLIETGQSSVVLEARNDLVHDVFDAKRIHFRWLLVVGEQWWRVGVRG